MHLAPAPHSGWRPPAPNAAPPASPDRLLQPASRATHPGRPGPERRLPPTLRERQTLCSYGVKKLVNANTWTRESRPRAGGQRRPQLDQPAAPLPVPGRPHCVGSATEIGVRGAPFATAPGLSVQPRIGAWSLPSRRPPSELPGRKTPSPSPPPRPGAASRGLLYCRVTSCK